MNSYIRFNEGIKLQLVKAETYTATSIEEAKADRNRFNASTILWNNFTDIVDALYYSPDNIFAGAICSIYRKAYGQQYYNFVCRIDNQNSLRDFNIHNKDYYDYLVVVAVKQSDGTYLYQSYDFRNESGEKITLDTNWNSWSICDIEETEEEGIYTITSDVWLLGLNLNEENLTQNLNITAWDTLGKYPKISMGERNYDSGTFTSLLGEISYATCDPVASEKLYNEFSTYTEKIHDDGREIEKLTAWRKFCSNCSLKLLKDIKGQSWIVQITDNPTNNINTTSHLMPTTISFNWKEVENVEDVSIVVI